MDKSKPVGIWIGVSTEDQARGESPEHHRYGLGIALDRATTSGPPRFFI
jgi:hypothetical protein